MKPKLKWIAVTASGRMTRKKTSIYAFRCSGSGLATFYDNSAASGTVLCKLISATGTMSRDQLDGNGGFIQTGVLGVYCSLTAPDAAILVDEGAIAG